MEPAYFLIAILGCADGGTGCTPVATVPTHYENAAQCSAETGAALAKATEFDFPTMIAECRRAEPKAAASAGEGASRQARRG